MMEMLCYIKNENAKCNTQFVNKCSANNQSVSLNAGGNFG
jgi:hypothetical protein